MDMGLGDSLLQKTKKEGLSMLKNWCTIISDLFFPSIKEMKKKRSDENGQIITIRL